MEQQRTGCKEVFTKERKLKILVENRTTVIGLSQERVSFLHGPKLAKTMRWESRNF